jgi:hypothetical protein
MPLYLGVVVMAEIFQAANGQVVIEKGTDKVVLDLDEAESVGFFVALLAGRFKRKDLPPDWRIVRAEPVRN